MDDYLCVYFDVYLAAGIKLFVYYAIMAFIIYRAQSKYPFLKIFQPEEIAEKEIILNLHQRTIVMNKDKLKILIVSCFFPPLNVIGGMRVYFWAKYWSKDGS